jgi:hypothetical protein
MTRTRQSLVACAALAAIAWLFPSCGGDGPSGPTAGGTPPPSASPTPTPSATPPTGSSRPRSCQGLSGTGTPSGCRAGQPLFASDVSAAQQAALGAAYRDPSTGETVPVADGTKILVASAYLQEIVDALDAKGLCAVYDGEEMNVRNGDVFNEHYDLITSDGRSWANYVSTCNPALPLPVAPPPPGQRDPDCRLPPSRAYFCFHDQPSYEGDVYGALDDLIAEDKARTQPIIFDHSGPVGGAPYTFRIINNDLYVSELLKKLKARGFCAAFDGEEFNVKRSNIFSENYDLTKAEGWSIRVYGATCRDADF